MDEKLIESLKASARREAWYDDPDFIDVGPMDFCAGNFDDAYRGGYDDGRTVAAREILTALGISWVKP